MNSNEQMERAWQRAEGVVAAEVTPEDHLLAEMNIKGENASILKSLMSRRAVLQQLSAGTLALMAGAAMGGKADAQNTGTYGPSLARDIDILNFALNDEYLESEFYSYATSGKGIDTFGIGITGQDGTNTGKTATPGTTTGGVQISFSDPIMAAVANQLADDERKHVNYIRNTIVQLNGTPIARPSLNLAALSALGVNSATVAGFLITGRSFCDVGVSAYTGTSKYLTNQNVIQSAAQILAVEAFHAGNLRLQIAQLSLSAPQLDAVDVPPPPASPNYFPVDAKAFAITRTVRQVLNIFYLDTTGTKTSGGFFPNGVNANLAPLLSLT